MNIRKYKKEDIEKIVKLEEECFNHSLGYDFLNSYLDNLMAYIYVIEDNNDIIGYISTMFDGEIIEIMNFCISPKRRKEGLGESLLKHVFSELLQEGAKSSFLEVRESNIGAISLYHKLGYKEINRRKQYYSDGEDALVLQLIF